MLRSANFTLTLAELGSAAETALKLEAKVPKIAAAIRPRRPVEAVEVSMVVSWIGFARWAVVVGSRSTSALLGVPCRTNLPPHPDRHGPWIKPDIGRGNLPMRAFPITTIGS